MNDFVVWRSCYEEGLCVIGNPHGLEDQFPLLDGVPLLTGWPEKVTCKMSPKYPKDIQLADNLYGCSYPIVSGRIKEQIAAADGGGQIEFLPVTILNHKGRVASTGYYFLNPVGSVDCIDIDKSRVKWNAIDNTVISSFEQLVLKEDAIPPGVAVFRPKHRTQTILASRSLADRLEADGFTGLYFMEPSQFQG